MHACSGAGEEEATKTCRAQIGETTDILLTIMPRSLKINIFIIFHSSIHCEFPVPIFGSGIPFMLSDEMSKSDKSLYERRIKI